MTLADMLAALYGDLGYEAVPDARVTTRLTRYLNEGYRQVMSMSEFGPLRSSTLNFASVPNQKLYGLPIAIQAIDQIVDLTNNVRVRLMTQDQFRTLDPQEVSSGTPTFYVPWGYSPTKRDPQVTGLWVTSSSAADTTQTASITGATSTALDTGMPQGPVTVTLNGLTVVQLGTLVNYVSVMTFELSAVAVGIVNLVDALVGGNVLAQIPPGKKTVQYETLRLWPTPAGIYQYAVDGTMPLTDLVQPYDSPLLPDDFQPVLTAFGRMREYEYRDDSRMPLAAQQFAMNVKLMRDRVCDPPDYRPRVGRIADRSSNLGSYYPPGRW